MNGTKKNIRTAFLALTLILILDSYSEACWRLRSRHVCAVQPTCPMPYSNLSTPCDVCPPFDKVECKSPYVAAACGSDHKWQPVQDQNKAVGCVKPCLLGQPCDTSHIDPHSARADLVCGMTTDNKTGIWRRAKTGEKVLANLPSSLIGTKCTTDGSCPESTYKD